MQLQGILSFTKSIVQQLRKLMLSQTKFLLDNSRSFICWLAPSRSLWWFPTFMESLNFDSSLPAPFLADYVIINLNFSNMISVVQRSLQTPDQTEMHKKQDASYILAFQQFPPPPDELFLLVVGGFGLLLQPIHHILERGVRLVKRLVFVQHFPFDRFRQQS